MWGLGSFCVFSHVGLAPVQSRVIPRREMKLGPLCKLLPWAGAREGQLRRLRSLPSTRLSLERG